MANNSKSASAASQPAAEKEITISGRVVRVIYEKPEDNFYILSFMPDDPVVDPKAASSSASPYRHVLGTPVTVRGNVYSIGIKIGTWFRLRGRWVDHPTYKRQILITKAPLLENNWDALTCANMLRNQVPSPVVDHYLDHFGDDLYAALTRGDFHVPACTEGEQEAVGRCWRFITSEFQVLQALEDLGLPARKIKAVRAAFPDDLSDVLSNDPWRLLEIDVVSFGEVDEIALRMGVKFDDHDPRRIRGAILSALRIGMSAMGHNYVTIEVVVGTTSQMVPGASDQEVYQQLANLHKRQLLHLERGFGGVCVYTPWIHRMESGSASDLVDRLETAKYPPDVEHNLKKRMLPPDYEGDFDKIPLRKIVKNYVDRIASAGSNKIHLGQAQMEGVVNAICEPVSIITGLPGTGKSTSLSLTVKVLTDLGFKVQLAAPTGIAAKRMASVTGHPASTVHKMLGATGQAEADGMEAVYSGILQTGDASSSDASHESWAFNRSNPLRVDVLVVDEASMVDQTMLFRIMDGTSLQCRIVFVGDAAQLPSVGPGNVLRDLIATRVFPTVQLTEIYRQAETSDIVLAAHDIFCGKTPRYSGSKQFIMHEVPGESEALDVIQELAQKLYERRDNFQVLSPRHQGKVGVTNLNRVMRETLNPKGSAQTELRVGKETIREGDRAMVVKNDYQLGVFNGDVGKVSRYDATAKAVVLKLHGPPEMYVTVPQTKVGDLIRMAYAITVHKCVSPDTWVETEDGLVRAEDAVKKPTGKIMTPWGFREFDTPVVNPAAPALRLETTSGYALTVTPDHRVEVWDPDTGFASREARNMAQGNWVRLKLGWEPLSGSNPLPEPPALEGKEQTYKVPSQMTESLAEFLGLMVADGTITSRGFRLVKRHKDVADRFRDLAVRLFGSNPMPIKVANAYGYAVHSTYLVRWLNTVGGMSPHQKQVPQCVLGSGTSCRAAFLRGVFEDGSVNVKEGVADHVEWESKFPVLVEQVRMLLLQQGIVSGGRGKKLYIYPTFGTAFSERVGFVSGEKNSKLLFGTPGKSCYHVPVEKTKILGLREDFRKYIGVGVYQNALNRGKVSRRDALKIVQSFPQDHPLGLLIRDRLEWHYEKVKSIVPTTSTSVCVRVPEGGRFLQNGIDGSNSQGQEYDTIIMPLLTSFSVQLQRNLLYTAITRAKRRVILVGSSSALQLAVLNNREASRNTLLRDRILHLTKQPLDTED